MLVHLGVVARSCCGGGGCHVRVHALQRALQRRAKGGSSGAEVGLPRQKPLQLHLVFKWPLEQADVRQATQCSCWTVMHQS